jgi:outer membrane protein assembly factor BamA
MEEVKQHADNPIYAVDLKITQTGVNHQLIKSFAKQILQSRTVAQLQSTLISAIEDLHQLNVFRNCSVLVEAGEFEDTASVEIGLVDTRSWEIGLDFTDDFEGGSTSVSGVLRNLRRKADLTSVALQYRHNTGTTGYSLTHTDQLFVPRKLIADWKLLRHSCELDQNLLEVTSGYEFSLTTFDHKHSLDLGRHLRTNMIAVQFASLPLLDELPNSNKNFLAHTYTLADLDDAEEPSSGYSVKLRNELALGDDAQFHKCEVKGSVYRSVLDFITLETTGFVGWFFPWSSTKTHVNDRFRCR